MGQPLKTYYTGRLRRIMRAYKQPLPQGEAGYAIPPVPYVAMGNYEGNVQTIDPRGSELWSNLYRIGSAGALSRVAPFGPSAFGDDEGPSPVSSVLPLIAIFGLAAGVMWVMGK
jgi:hypothetical protein